MPRLRASSGDLGVDRPALDEHDARRERNYSRHHFRQSRFAGAVLADERVNLAEPQLEIDGVDRRNF